MPTSNTFKSKLLNPCNKLLRLLKFRFKTPIFKPSSRLRKVRRRKRIRGFFSIFRSSMRSSKETEENVGELPRSMTEAGRSRPLFPSPITPSYMKLGGGVVDQVGEIRSSSSDVEDSCRSFEKYLAEMIVEEGKVTDLVDVEELLYCWKNLKCPIFNDLVCRFYGELCRDLFSGEDYDQEEEVMH